MPEGDVIKKHVQEQDKLCGYWLFIGWKIHPISHNQTQALVTIEHPTLPRYLFFCGQNHFNVELTQT
jgi:hypothetical protein